AFVQVGQWRRVEPGHANVGGEGQGRSGQHRVLYFGEEVGDLHLDVLLGEDVLADGVRFFGDLVEQVCVDVVADAEAKDARVVPAVFPDIAHDLVFAGHADGRQAVGEEDDDERSCAAFGPERQRFLQRVV